MAKNNLLKLINISKKYQMDGLSVQALNNINLIINEKELVSIVGPSGCGKSTLMHIIGCLDRPSAGEIYFKGKNISKMSDNELAFLRNREIGFVFQAFNLLSRTSALQNVALPLIYSGVSERKRIEKAKKQLELFGLGDRIYHHPNQLSGGQQQRVAIARALITEPSIILADEPTGNLDSKSGKEIINLLKKLNQGGKTVIIVTHDLTLASEAKRVIAMKDGEILS